jgi:HupE / UreJ protein
MNRPWLPLLVCTCFLAGRAAAHTASTAWMEVGWQDRILAGRWEIPLRDLDDLLGIDSNDDGRITWGELKRRHADIASAALQALSVEAGGRRLPLHAVRHAVSERGGAPCEVLFFESDAVDSPSEATVRYRFLFDRDPLHRCLAAVSRPGGGPGAAAVLSPDHPDLVVVAGARLATASFPRFVREGVHHILTGFDHLLFLLVLLLPAVVLRDGRGWAPNRSFPSSLSHVLQVVTAFTFAHSLTLALAALDVVRLPSRPVECAIAVSIILAAVANLTPDAAVAVRGLWARWKAVSSARPWLAPFAFGLVHGFGFAGALAELGLRREALAVPLLGFNVGVEVGQLACVAAFLPAAFALRATRFYRWAAVPVGSALICLIAGVWLVERAFDVKWLPI